jgi:transcriptional regulator with XRE-family HTH domain
MVFSLAGFGRRVRILRRAHGFTQEQLAEAADLNTRTLQKIEAGQVNILLTTLARIQSALGCTAGELLDPDAVLVLRDPAMSHGMAPDSLPDTHPTRPRWPRRSPMGS